ncbi:flagellar hook-length control protein FliK [Paenibacillus graminis]|uniref:flagellar hook-length control protein FliK n=1 Tax=Paenibacillus graminis TaxID=189425 RepID=UPI0004B4133F|nr:flagellar hook-length control protein FliK [Paenibacillus graminis]
MSLVVPSMSGGNKAAAAGTSTTAGAGTAAGTASAAPFAQTLVQTLGAVQTTETAAPAVLGNLASLLQGLMNAVQAAGEETGTDDTAKSAELLQGLTEDLEKLDEDISSDPALMAALQGWLLQVSALLSGSAPAEGTSTAGSTPADTLSPLAQNPETLRFAVQDELNSLVGLVQQATAEGKEQTASAGITLLNHFTAILADTLVPDNKAKAKPAVSTDTTPVVLKPVSETESNVEVKAKTPVLSDLRSKPTAAATTENTAAVPAATVTAETAEDTVAAPLAKVALTADVSKNGAETEVLPGAKPAEEDHEIVTAGQLSLRGGITAPLKAETPPVPVHQFASEMTSFITGKLEIVKKGGVAEATITLFPENLGQVDVKITMQNGHLVAQFLTEHAGAKDMLEQQMSQLRSALQQQGLQVEKLEVTQNNTPLQSQYNGSHQGRGTGSGNQQQERRSKERTEEISDAVLAAELNGEWKEWVAGTQQDSRPQGGSFSAKV